MIHVSFPGILLFWIPQPMEEDGSPQKLIDMTGQTLGGSQVESARGRKRSHNEAKDAPVPVAMLQQQQPESYYVNNSAVERQFFESAREGLASYTRDGGQAWAEFFKCLDMYAQEILSRNEMLNFV
jgi:paired amphipathic helix protein Sin3a